MDEYPSRRAAGGLVVSRRSSSLVLRDSSENPRERNNAHQVCSRVGCSSKSNQAQPSQLGSLSKAKTPTKTPFRPPGLAREIIGKSPALAPSTSRKPSNISDMKRKSRFRAENDSESSSTQEESDQGTSQPSGNMKRSTGACSSTSFGFKRGPRNDGASTSKCSNMKSHYSASSSSSSSSSFSSSSSEGNVGKRRDIGLGRKRVGEPESSFSSARGKKMSGGPMATMDDDKRGEISNRGISISDSRRTTRNLSVGPTAGDSETGSIRTRRFTPRTRLGASQENRTRLPLGESPLSTLSSSSSSSSSSLSRPEISRGASAFGSGNQFSAQNPSRPGSSGDLRRGGRSIPPYEVGIPRSFVNRDGLRQYNLDGIAEMLLALERIEQEEEPTYEQLLVLETNLFLGGLGFHDQHRDMRLDIDNMSYEELLALEERIGTVSTGVPEEDLPKCLKLDIYQGIITTECCKKEDDVICSVCQEEYELGEEVGRLKCDHRYHVECINQWLRLKNWCPICKASALPSPSSSASLS